MVKFKFFKKSTINLLLSTTLIKDLGNKWFAFSKLEDDNFELLKKLSEEAHVKYPNSPLGGFFNLNVADGRVQYQITEIKGNTAYAKLCHGICLDMYQDDILGDGDWISLKKATELVNGQIAMAKLFRR
mgnify:CR=1 FL=1